MRHTGWFLALCVFVPAYAQTERGNITGEIRDPSGAAIPGAEVIAIHLSTNVQTKAVSTPAGDYNLTVPPGTYRLLITAAGFKRYERENVTVATASTVRLDAALDLGTLSESVRVSTEVTQIQTETAKVSTAVPNRLVDELPLVVGGTLRSPFDLVTIAPESRGSGQTLVLGGGQAAAWNATLDGLSVTTNRSADTVEIAYLAPSVEAITEFTVDTNGFKAEYGQAGGGVMTFSSKSGTNEVHGSAYDFLRNDALDARGFFAPTRSVYKQNDFGATLGAPVYLPRIYNGRNRTFFFVSYEGFRNRAGNNGRIFSVPTPEMYQGDFSKWVNSAGNVLAIYDPASTRANPNGSGSIRDAFPGNRIPAARFSAFAAQLLPYGSVVKPNRGAAPGTFAYVQNNYISTSGSVLSPQDKGSVKADHVIGNNHRVGFLFNITRYRQDPGADGPPGLPMPLWDGQASLFNTEVYRLSYDWTISPRMLNSFSIGGNKFLKESFSPNAGNDPVKGGNWESKLCMKNVVSCTVNFPQIGFTEAQGWGGSGYNGTLQPMWALKDDLSYTRGKHNFKFGYAYQWQFAAGIGEQLISGQAGFSFLGTSVPAATSFTSGSSFASFLLGWADSGGTDSKRYTPQIYGYHGFYAQDDWHVTPRLTLNLGLRYEFTRPPVNEIDEYTDFDPRRPNPAVNNYPGAIVFAGFGPGRENKRTLVPGWYGAIGPRLGLAYSPDGSKTTIRSAFGRSFSRVSVTSGSGHYEGFGISPRFNSPDQDITPAFQLDKGLPPYLLPPQINPAFQNNLAMDYWNGQDASRASESLYWTLSLQRQLTANTLIEAGYDATVGTHLQTGLLNINQMPTVYLNRFIQQYGATGALNLLRADISSPLARSAGIPIPYPNFTDPNVQQFRTVAQALRPFPQFQTIATAAVGGGGIGAGNGDKSGHSSYHGLLIKAERRFSRGLTFQWNYTLSKILTDSDTYYTSNQAQDHYNRGLEKSIGAYDQTHSLKMSTLYELPIGKGKRFLSGAFAGRLLGGWRVGAIQSYASGFPLALSRNNPFPIFNGPTRPVIASYDGWRAPIGGDKFDPNRDKFLDRNVFPAQPSDQFGNVTRFNPKLRSFPLFNENVSLAKSFYFTERKRLDFRAEAFNLFNRTRFGNPSANLNASTFGVVSSQANAARQMQMALKLYW